MRLWTHTRTLSLSLSHRHTHNLSLTDTHTLSRSHTLTLTPRTGSDEIVDKKPKGKAGGHNKPGTEELMKTRICVYIEEGKKCWAGSKSVPLTLLLLLYSLYRS